MLLYANYDIQIEEDMDGGQVSMQRIPVSRYIIEEIHRDEMSFRNPVFQKIFDEFDLALRNGEEPDEKRFIRDNDDEALSTVVRDLLLNPYELSENWLRNRVLVVTEKDHLLQAVETTLLSFKSKTIDRMIYDIMKEMKAATDEADIMILQARQKELKEISSKINGILGRVVVK
jgi:hypothetical protein